MYYNTYNEIIVLPKKTFYNTDPKEMKSNKKSNNINDDDDFENDICIDSNSTSNNLINISVIP